MQAEHLTQITLRLDHLGDNLKLLSGLAGDRPLWPAIKANAYGHGAEIVARRLLERGYHGRAGPLGSSRGTRLRPCSNGRRRNAPDLYRPGRERCHGSK